LGIPLPFTEEIEVVIVIAVSDRRDGWVGLSACPPTIRSEPKVGLANLNENEMALGSGAYAALSLKKS